MLSNSSKVVRTLRGDMDASRLGHTQCHEHIWLRKGPSFDSNPALCMDDFERSLAELKLYAEAGGGSILDAQPGYFGRDAQMLHQLSEKSGVNIIAVTGFHKLMFMEPDSPLPAMSIAELTDHFASEIEEGMLNNDGERTPYRAGLVKVAFEAGGLTDPHYAPLFEAAACAAARTGAHVLVHTEKKTDLMELIRFCASFGVPAERMLICHLDRTNTDPDVHRQILGTGAALCYDSVHRLKYISNEEELGLIRRMCEEGYDGQIVLSLDTTNQRLRSYCAQDMGLDYIMTDFIPMMRKAGITEEAVEKMCRVNAQSALSIQ